MKASFISFYTIVQKEVKRFLRIWPQTLVPPVITQTLYFIIFGAFIGSQLSEINGISYMAFIVPGLMMMAIINMAYTNVVSSFYIGKFFKNIEEMIVAPVSNHSIIWGYSLGGMLRGLIVGVFIFIISAFFTQPTVHSFGMIVLFSILTAAIFSLAGLINGIFARSFDDINVFPTFVLIPLTYFGGVFYSIHDLPEVWQTASKFNPILYMVDGLRYGFYGFSDLNVWYSLAMLVGLTVVLSGVNVYLLNKGIGLKK